MTNRYRGSAAACSPCRTHGPRILPSARHSHLALRDMARRPRLVHPRGDMHRLPPLFPGACPRQGPPTGLLLIALPVGGSRWPCVALPHQRRGARPDCPAGPTGTCRATSPFPHASAGGALNLLPPISSPRAPTGGARAVVGGALDRLVSVGDWSAWSITSCFAQLIRVHRVGWWGRSRGCHTGQPVAMGPVLVAGLRRRNGRARLAKTCRSSRPSGRNDLCGPCDGAAAHVDGAYRYPFHRPVSAWGRTARRVAMEHGGMLLSACSWLGWDGADGILDRAVRPGTR